MPNIVDDVRLAMKNHELCAYYQPQFDTLSENPVSAEALVRWIKPDGKVVSPAAFMPELEKSEAIDEVDWYMLREVCALLKKQKESGIKPNPIAVNFSRNHIVYEHDFAKKLAQTVDDYGIEHSLIEAEITESAFVTEAEAVADFVKSIRAEGFTVAIDDFGSGVSSLSFVKDVEVDTLKTDMSLISHNCQDEKERIVLESIFLFAHRLKLRTVAEGVETSEQLGFMKACDCELIQGYLYSKPVPEAEYLELCKKPKKNTEGDILVTQPHAAAINLLLSAVFEKYPLVIFSNLTQNSFYMMEYSSFTTTSCPASGNYEELIEHGASTMYPGDDKIFRETFNRKRQLKLYEDGKPAPRITTRQLGDDGIYRNVETQNFFVKNPSSSDVLVITLCENKD